MPLSGPSRKLKRQKCEKCYDTGALYEIKAPEGDKQRLCLDCYSEEMLKVRDGQSNRGHAGQGL